MNTCAILTLPCPTKTEALRWRFIMEVMTNPNGKESQALSLLGKPFLNKQPTKQQFSDLIDRARHAN